VTIAAEVGKTTLAASLERGMLASLWQSIVGTSNSSRELADDALVERTRGVAVRRLSIQGGAEFSLWDYAGQEEVRRGRCVCVCVCV
jgi:GTPase SAR1 family protein